MTKKVEIISKLPTVFVRTLEDGQVLCPECGGIQLVSDGKHIIGCQSCLGKQGVLNRCQYCGEPETYNHSCQGKKDYDQAEQYNRKKDKWDNTPKITIEEAVARFEMVYVDQFEEFVEPDMLTEWIEDHESDDEDFDRTVLRVYGTHKTQITLDAGGIVEDACGDLHDDAMERISRNAIDELQAFLDVWAKNHGAGTVTYHADFSIGIVI